MVATSVFVAEVGEPPDVAEAHRVAQAGQEKVALIVPVSPLLNLSKDNDNKNKGHNHKLQ